MAKPTLSKSGVTTVTLSKASTFPGSSPKTINQFVGVSDDNTIRVASLGPARTTLEVVFEQLTNEDLTNLLAFFENPLVNWGANAFTYTDEDGVAYTVRFLQPEFAPRTISDDNVQLNLVLTVV